MIDPTSPRWLSTGAAAGRDSPLLVNPPGLTEIDYRVGTLETFTREMVARLPRVRVPTADGTGRHAPLAHLDLDPRDDWILALLRAWALVGDVLTFYQERIANEQFLGTAVQPVSVEDLVWSLGARRRADTAAADDDVDGGGLVGGTVAYRADPGCAAETDVAFTVVPSRSSPHEATIPAGAALQAHGSGTPVVFETSGALDVSSEWCAMRAFQRVSRHAPALTAHTRGFWLDGTATGLAAGAPLLVVGTSGTGAGSPRRWRFGALATVEPDAKRKRTLVTWDGALVNQDGDETLSDLALTTPARSAAVFGADARPITHAPVKTRMTAIEHGGLSRAPAGSSPPTFAAVNDGLPDAAVRALALDGAGNAYLGTAKGVLTLAPDGTSWSTDVSGLTTRDVHALAVAADGSVLAGTASGGVFRTMGPGAGWSPLAGSFKSAGKGAAPRKTALPSAIVSRVLGVFPIPLTTSAMVVLALIEQGVWCNRLDGNGWSAVNPANFGGDGAANVTFSDVAAFGPFAAVATKRDVYLYAWDSPTTPLGGTSAAERMRVRRRRPASTSTDTSALIADLEAARAKTPDSTLEFSLHHDVVRLAFVGTGLDTRLMAATTHGASVLEVLHLGFVDASHGLPAGAPLRDLAAVPDPGALGGITALASLDDGVYGFTPGSSPSPGSWTRLATTTAPTAASDPTGTPPPAVARVAAASETGEVVIGAPITFADDWPDAALSASTLRVQRGLGCPVSGSPIVVTQQPTSAAAGTGTSSAAATSTNSPAAGANSARPGSPPSAPLPTTVLTVEHANEETATGFGKKDQVVRLALGAGPEPQSTPEAFARTFTRTGALVQGQAKPLPLAQTVEVDDSPVGGLSVEIDGTPLGLAECVAEARAAASHAAASTSTGASTNPLPTLTPAWARRAGVPASLGARHEAAPDVAAASPTSPGRRLAISGPAPRALLVGAGGVLSRPSDGTWVGDGLTSLDVRALAVSHTVLAATDAGVYERAPDVAADWRADIAGLAGAALDVTAVLETRTHTRLAATAAGLFVRAPDADAWTATASPPASSSPRVLASSLRSDDTETLWCGTRRGLYRSDDDGASWTLDDAGSLPARATVTALATGGDGTTAVATDDGVHVRRAAGGPWTRVDAGLDGTAVLALDAVPGGALLLAGTRGAGVLVLDPGAASPCWSPRSTGLPPDVTAVLATDASTWWAASPGAGVSRSTDAGASWVVEDTRVADDVTTLAPTPGGAQVLAGAGARTWLRGDTERPVASWGLTRLGVLDETFASTLDGRLPTAALRAALVRVHADVPESYSIDRLARSRRWLVTGGDDAWVLQRLPDCIAVLRPDEALSVTAAPTADTGSASCWTLATREGAIGRLTARDDEIVLRPSLAQDALQHEIRTIAQVDVAADGASTRLLLDRPLELLYDRALTTFNANVVHATQGVTVSDEVLGDGNPDVANQTFTLRRPPLTFLRAPPPRYRRSTLTVSVDGIAWQQVDTLYGQAPDARVYSVLVTSDGNAQITFGDGVHGARLPPGPRNVTATYRSGLGPSGDVGAAKLTVLVHAPPGVSKVTNPLAVDDAVAPESAAALRVRAPQQLQAMGRLVSRRDYATFAQTYPGVAKAASASLDVDGRPVLVITVALDTRLSATEAAARVAALGAEAAASGAVPAPPVSVLRSESIQFVLEAELWLAPDATPEEVTAAARAALADRFGFDRRALGQPVEAAEVEATLQATAGVQGAALRVLAREGHARTLHARLDAAHARRGPDGTVRPAQLLTLATSPGAVVLVTTVVASPNTVAGSGR